VQDQLACALEQVKKMFSLDTRDILTEKVITIPHAYVIYNAWRDKHIANLLKGLEEYGIYSIGRYGAWKYSSMQDAILDGKKIAEQIMPLVVKKCS
jgi:protoporphyrinogen oxidase